jgi:hypothetical protein
MTSSKGGSNFMMKKKRRSPKELGTLVPLLNARRREYGSGSVAKTM